MGRHRVFGWYAIFRFDYDDDENDDFSTATAGCGMYSSETNETLVAWCYGVCYGRAASNVYVSFSTPTTCIESSLGHVGHHAWGHSHEGVQCIGEVFHAYHKS